MTINGSDGSDGSLQFLTPKNGQWVKQPATEARIRGSGKPSVEAPHKPLPEAEPLELTDIPGAMRKMGWYYSGALLDKWFSYSPKNQAETSFQKAFGYKKDGSGVYPADRIDRDTIKLDWILSFPRAKEAFEKLKTDKILININAMRRLDAIMPQYATNKYQAPFLDVWQMCKGDIQKIHNHFQFQLAPVDTSAIEKAETYIRNPDDLAGALGGFSFYAAVAEARININFFDIDLIINKVFLYMKNPFSFYDDPSGGSQYLGHWSKDGVALSGWSFLAQKADIESWIDRPVQPEGPHGRTYWPVHNSDFRRWQNQHNAGGDMILFSEPRVFNINPIKLRFKKPKWSVDQYA